MVVTKTIRVMIVDDFDMVRTGLKFAIEKVSDMTVVAEASSGEEAVRICHDHRPDVILMDILMPEIDGIQAARRILALDDTIKIIALTSADDDDLVHQAIEVGMTGYLLKNLTSEALANAIRKAHAGKSTLAQEATQSLMRATMREPTPGDDITPAEMRVLELLVEGLSNREIAQSLFISISTVKNHVSSLLQKLDVNNRAGAVAIAVRYELIPPPQHSSGQEQ